MSAVETPTRHHETPAVDRTRESSEVRPPIESEHQGHRHGHWMMIACCIPMLAIAVAIAASGAGIGFLVGAVICTAMMALMMAGMSHGGGR